MDKRALIVDIDGTIADCNHRLHHIKGHNKNWPEFWKTMHLDEPIHDVIQLVQSMRGAGHPILIVTARDDNVRDQTMKWLAEHGIVYDAIYMRTYSDSRPDHVVKKELLAKIREDGYNVLFALEDRQHNVDMFRSEGITCLHVADDQDDYGPPARDWDGQQVVTLLVGPVAAGKSTYTKTFDPATIVSSDDIREQVTGWDRNDNATWLALTDKDHARTWDAVHRLVKTRAECGLQTVVDATNIKRRDRMAIVKLVPPTQTIEYVILDRPLADKIRDRGWRSEELVRRMHDSFNAGIKHALRGDDQPNVMVVDMRKVLA